MRTVRYWRPIIAPRAFGVTPAPHEGSSARAYRTGIVVVPPLPCIPTIAMSLLTFRAKPCKIARATRSRGSRPNRHQPGTGIPRPSRFIDARPRPCEHPILHHQSLEVKDSGFPESPVLTVS